MTEDYRKFAQSKKFKWCDREITVSEIMAGDIIKLVGADKTKDPEKPGKVDDSLSSTDALFQHISEVCKIATGMEIKEIAHYPPSKIWQLMGYIEEVNRSFFLIAECFGMSKSNIKRMLEQHIRTIFTMTSFKQYMS